MRRTQMNPSCRKCGKIIPIKTVGTTYYKAELLKFRVHTGGKTISDPLSGRGELTILYCCDDCGALLGRLFGVYIVSIGENGEVVDKVDFNEADNWKDDHD